MTDSLIEATAERLERRVPAATSVRHEVRVSFEFFPPATEAGTAALEASAQQLGPSRQRSSASRTAQVEVARRRPSPRSTC